MSRASLSLACVFGLASVCFGNAWVLPDIDYAKVEPKSRNALFFKHAHILEGGKSRLWLRVAGASSRLAVYDARGKKVRDTRAPRGEAWSDFAASGLAPGKYGVRIEENGAPRAEGVFWIERPNAVARARVPLFVDEPIGVDWKSFPVRLGVPFSPCVITSTDLMRVVDAQGREVPAQFQVTAYCTPEKRDIRWVLVTFFADSKKGEGGRYFLEYGSKVRRHPAAGMLPKPLRVDDAKSSVRVDTGAIRFTVNKDRGSLIEDLSLGGASVLANGSLFVQNQDRESFNSFLDKPEVKVEESGPLSCVIRLRGWYRNEAGRKFCRYVVRLHAFAGKPYLKIYHTWIFTEDSRKTRIGDISLRLNFADPAARCAFGTDPERKGAPYAAALGKSMVSLIQEDSDAFAVKRFPITPGRRPLGLPGDVAVGRTEAKGRQSGGWLAAWTPRATVAVHLRNLWQMYPVELEVNPSSLAVHFWPEHGFSYAYKPHGIGRHRWPLSDGPILDLQPREWVEQTAKMDREFVFGYEHINAKGVARTHELWLHVAPPDTRPSGLRARAACFEKPLAGRADAAWISGTGVFRPFLPHGPDRFPEVEKAIEARWDAVLHNQALSHNYGWLFWGNQQTYNYITPHKRNRKPRFRGPYVVPTYGAAKAPDGTKPYYKRIHRYWKGLAYRSGMEPWLLWVRSGKRRYFDFAEALTRQIEDIYIANHDRWDLKCRGVGGKGYRYTCCFIPYNANCDPDGSHMDAIGHSRMNFYLTGFRRSYDVADMVGRSMFDFDFKNFPRLSRTLMGTAHNMFEAYHMTHNEKYWHHVLPGINRVLDSVRYKALGHSTLNYFWELYYDWYNLHGDMRVKKGLDSVLDVYKRKPLGNAATYPMLFYFAHLYGFTEEREHLAYAFGDTILPLFCVNRASASPNFHGQIGYGDPISLTRTIRQVPGVLHYVKQADRRGRIRPRFRPIRFSGDPRVLTGAYVKNIPNRGPVYLLDETDEPFEVRLFFGFSTRKKFDIRIKVALYAPDGSLVAKRNAERREFTRRNINARKRPPFFTLKAPSDRQKGRYKLTFEFEPKDIGYEYYVWGVECANIRKIAYALKKFRYSGVAFFRMPEDRNRFKLVMTPGNGYKGDLVAIDAEGHVVKRLNGQQGATVLGADKALESGRMYGIVGGPEIEFVEGVNAVFANADEYFPVKRD